MLSVNFYFFIFLLFFQQASTQEFNITVLMANCLPVAVGLQNEAIAQYQLQKGCQSLELPYREMLDLKCCEVEYQEKENSSAPRYHGCMSFLSNYIAFYRKMRNVFLSNLTKTQKCFLTHVGKEAF